MDIKPLEILVKPGTAPFGDIFELFLAIDTLYVSMGGSGLKLTSTDMFEEEVPESPYESHPITPFTNTKKVLQESTFTRYVPRQQVYDAIDKFAKPDMVAKIRREIDKKFPEDKFDDVFPYSAVFNILFNDHLRYSRTDS